MKAKHETLCDVCDFTPLLIVYFSLGVCCSSGKWVKPPTPDTYYKIPS